MTSDSEFTFEEKNAMKELRKRMKDEMEAELYEDSYLFYRFLRARDFNVNDAESMLRKHLEWRKRYDIKNVANFKILEVLEKYMPYDLIGYDKEGCVIRFCAFGNLDILGLNASCTSEDFLKFIIYCSEMDTINLKKQSEKYGRNIEKIVFITNFENLSFVKATSKENIYNFINWINVIQNNYPERVKAVYVYNVSAYFNFLFMMLKPFIAKRLLEKMNFYSDDSYKEELKKIIDDDVLPAFLGGTRTDPDGNPMCLSFIKHGGPIPETYYIPKNKKLLSKSPGVENLTLPRAAYHEIVLDVKEPHSTLEWEFETKARDIGFGLFYQDKSDGEERNVEIIPLQRIDTDISSETGTFKCDKVGSYVVVFDNTYSCIRSKDIFYRLKILTPMEQESQITK